MTLHRSTPSTHSQSASESASTGPDTTTPALLCTTWTAPKAAMVLSASASIASHFDTSVGTPMTSWPAPRRWSTVSLRACSSISARTTFIPSSANLVAVARPMPLAAPVTTATLFLNSFTLDSPLVDFVSVFSEFLSPGLLSKGSPWYLPNQIVRNCPDDSLELSKRSTGDWQRYL